MSLNHILQKNTENTTENSLDVVFHDIKCNSISFELSDNVLVIPNVQVLSSPSGTVLGNINLTFVRNGSMCLVQIPQFNIDLSALPSNYADIFTPIPAEFKPSSNNDMYWPCCHAFNSNLPAMSVDACVQYSYSSNHFFILNSGTDVTNIVFPAGSTIYIPYTTIMYYVD